MFLKEYLRMTLSDCMHFVKRGVGRGRVGQGAGSFLAEGRGKEFFPPSPEPSASFPMTAGATTEGTSLLLSETLRERVRHFDGTVQATAEWTHRNALPPPCPIPKNRKFNIDIIPNHATSMPVARK